MGEKAQQQLKYLDNITNKAADSGTAKLLTHRLNTCFSKISVNIVISETVAGQSTKISTVDSSDLNRHLWNCFQIPGNIMEEGEKKL